MCEPSTILFGGSLKFEVISGGIPELSVADGTVQVITAEKCPLSGCTRSGSMGHESPNEGGSTSEKMSDC